MKAGDKIGRFEILRPHSRGGMAEVWEARRVGVGGVSARVAIKRIRPEHAEEKAYKELFVNEACLSAQMRHQNLISVQEFIEHDGDQLLVMEYIEGITLRQILSTAAKYDQRIPLGVIVELGRQAAMGLHHAHNTIGASGKPLELVHRDIKPSNLILTQSGCLKVLDFGVSKGRRMKERKGAVRGTWGYMSPEQSRGREVGPSADVYGLGLVLTELATLTSMFKGRVPDEIKKLLVNDHPARMATQLDPGYAKLIGVLVRALQRDPAARYQDAASFGQDLAALIPDTMKMKSELAEFVQLITSLRSGEPVPVPPGTLEGIGTVGSDVFDETRIQPTRRRSVLLGLSVVLAALTLTIVGFVLYAPNDLMAGEVSVAPVSAEEPPGPAGEGALGEVAPRQARARVTEEDLPPVTQNPSKPNHEEG